MRGLLRAGAFDGHPAVLTLLVPTIAPVGDRVGTQILESAEQDLVLRNLEFLSPDRDLDELFVGTIERDFEAVLVHFGIVARAVGGIAASVG